MASFEEAKKISLKLEGGYQAHPSDSGNYNSRGELVGTKYGIAAKTYEGATGVTPTVAIMKNLTLDKATAIYKSLFWKTIGGDHIKSQAVANNLFDHGVNAGVSRAVKMMQAALNMYFGEKLVIDGNVGPKTLEAINSAPSDKLHDRYKWMREKYYKYLGGLLDASDPIITFLKTLGVAPSDRHKAFVNGWLARLESFVDLAKKKPTSPVFFQCPSCGADLEINSKEVE